MDTLKVLSLVTKLAKDKDAALKLFLQNFFVNFPDWDNEMKKKVLKTLVESFEKTVEEIK